MLALKDFNIFYIFVNKQENVLKDLKPGLLQKLHLLWSVPGL